MSIERPVDYRATESYPNDRKITSYPFLVSALFYPMPGANFSLYILGGLGWYISKIEDSAGSSTAYTPGFQVGAGLDIPLNPNLVLNADLRYFLLNYGDQKVNDLKTNGFIISAGVTFYLW
jgi:opacity protein-like surface antigen